MSERRTVALVLGQTIRDCELMGMELQLIESYDHVVNANPAMIRHVEGLRVEYLAITPSFWGMVASADSAATSLYLTARNSVAKTSKGFRPPVPRWVDEELGARRNEL